MSLKMRRLGLELKLFLPYLVVLLISQALVYVLTTHNTATNGNRREMTDGEKALMRQFAEELPQYYSTELDFR